MVLFIYVCYVLSFDGQGKEFLKWATLPSRVSNAHTGPLAMDLAAPVSFTPNKKKDKIHHCTEMHQFVTFTRAKEHL